MRSLGLFLLLVVSLCAFATKAPQKPAPFKLQLSQMQLIGDVSYHYWFWHVYDIRLYAKSKPWSYKKPFALRLDYKRDFKGASITKETLKQIRRQNPKIDQVLLKRWREELNKVFPDIQKGQALVGYFNGKQQTFFYRGNGQYLGVIDGRDFAEAFFNIWLGKQSMDPKLTEQLIGNSR